MSKLLYAAFLSLFLLNGCTEQESAKESESSRDFRSGEYYDYYQNKDSAFYFYNRTVQNSTDSLEKGTSYFKMGVWQLEAGDYYSAQESFLLSLKTLDQKDTAHYSTIAVSYNSLANASLNLKDYALAIRNYHLALHFAQQNLRLHFLNNIGVAYQKKGDYTEAIAVFDSALAQPITDTSLKAKLISNSARTKWLADPRFSPVPYFMTALLLRRQISDSLGINSSFAHLSDYYSKLGSDSALYYALLRLQVAENLDDPGDRLEALAQLIKVSQPEQTKKYVEYFMKLEDSLNNIHSRDRNQFALIKFDAEKSKADNLLLEQYIGKQRLAIIAIVVLALVVFTYLRSRASARRRRMQEENERAIEQLQLQTSQKVHDVVANGLYRIMNKLEHEDTMEKEPLLDQIEFLYEQSRNIFYESIVSNNDAFSLRMQHLIAPYNTAKTRVTLVGNVDALGDHLSAFQKKELELVMAELMVNMKKHSLANTVVLSFKAEKGKGVIEYSDDGVGLGANHQFGNGLRNTVNRMNSISGEISFEKNAETGAFILISFPIEPL